MRRVKGLPVILTLLILTGNLAEAAPISASRGYQFLDHVANNSVGASPGERQQFGVTCVVLTGFPCSPQTPGSLQNPGAPFGTTGVATQGTSSIPLTFVASDLTSNHFAASRPPALVPDGQWTLTFSNGADSAQTTTPDIAGATKLDFVNSMTISGSRSAPTISWTLPAVAPGVAIDSVRVLIRDTTQFLGVGGVGGGGLAAIIFAKTLAAGATSFTVDPSDPALLQPLVPGKTYSLEVQLADTRNGLTGGGFPNTLSQSRSYADFTLLQPGAPPTVFLPTLVNGVFTFDVQGVGPSDLIFIDPFVAVGYDYAIGAGDPNFASVLLPNIGDGEFMLAYLDQGSLIQTMLDEGDQFSFPQGGVSTFRVTGIEVSAGLDPNNVTAFITGLTFVTQGNFTGTMTPIVVEQVPEPATFLLVGVGLSAMACVRWRQVAAKTRATCNRILA